LQCLFNSGVSLIVDILKEERNLQIKYSPDADVLLVKFRKGKPVDSVDVAEGLIAHYAEDGKIIELEILDASKIVQLSDVSLSLKGLEAVKV